MRRLWLVALGVLVLLPFGCRVRAFDLPASDPWYFQSDRMGVSFWTPDKFQHFYGSALLTRAGSTILPAKSRAYGPALVFVSGLFYEIWQGSTGVGFSSRDLIADGLGVLSAVLPRRVSLGCTYSKSDRLIIWRLAVTI